MHEAVVAEVDADVREGAAHGVEENEVARLEFVLGDGFADLALFLGGARQGLAEGVLEDELDEAAAIEAAVRIGAAATVLDADELETFEDERLRTVRIPLEQ